MRRIVQAADSVSVMFFKTELRNVVECFLVAQHMVLFVFVRECIVYTVEF